MVGVYRFGHAFHDELPEFDTRALEVMRQSLEGRVVTISPEPPGA
jgi:hypothetical protein